MGLHVATGSMIHTAQESDSQPDCGYLWGSFLGSFFFPSTFLNGFIQTGLVQVPAFRRGNKCSKINKKIKEATPIPNHHSVTGRGGGFVCFVLFQVIFATSFPREVSFFLLFLLSSHPPNVISSESAGSALTRHEESDAALLWIQENPLVCGARVQLIRSRQQLSLCWDEAEEAQM